MSDVIGRGPEVRDLKRGHATAEKRSELPTGENYSPIAARIRTINASSQKRGRRIGKSFLIFSGWMELGYSST
jgi:hypothetical protein